MNANQLIEAFHRSGDDPEHVLRLRKLVVASAITGRLSETNGQVDTAQIIKATEDAKAKLGKAGKIPKPKEFPETTQEDLPSDFDHSLTYVPLGQLARVEKGLTGIKDAKVGPFPLVVTAAERGRCDHFDYTGPAAIVPLVSSTGHGNASINRLHYQEDDFALGTILAAILPYDPETTSARFLFEYLTAFKEELLVARMTGSANVTLTLGKLMVVPVPVVCPDLQQKVAELMALLDQLEQTRSRAEGVRSRLTTATWARLAAEAGDDQSFASHTDFALKTLPTLTTTPAQIKTLRQTILNLAVRGKLVAQDPNDEPASVLLKRIEAEKARLVKAGEIRKPKQLSPVSTSDTPFQIPPGWALTRLGSVIDLLSGQHLQPPEYSEKQGVGVPYITGPSDFQSDGLSITRFALVRKAVARKGQLLLTVKGSGVGKTTICNLHEVAISRQLMAVTPILWTLEFLKIITHRLAENLQSQARSLIPGIAREDVEDFVFPLPPLSEQHRIVARVDALMALCDQLETALTTTATTRSRLLDTLIRRALSPDEELMEAAE